MTSQSDEKDLEEINFSLTPFNIFRYQRREKGVHLTLKREKNFMTRWNVNTHLHHQKELCANEVEENIFLIFMIVIICDNLNGIFMLIFFRLIKKNGFLSYVSFDCPGSAFMTSLGQHLLHHCLSHKRQNDPKRQVLKEKH